MLLSLLEKDETSQRTRKLLAKVALSEPHKGTELLKEKLAEK